MQFFSAIRMRQRVKKYGKCIFLYGCLLYLSAILFTFHRLNQEEVLTSKYYSSFSKDGSQNHTYTIGILTLKTIPMGPLLKRSWLNTSIVAKKMEFIKSQVSDRHGNITFSRMFIKTGSNSTLRKWDTSRPLVFVHIGKNGGTSFDRVMKPIITKLRGRYIGQRHFDWSYVDTIKNPDVLVLLRDPVSRAVSHFYFAKKRRVFKNNTLQLSDYLQNPQVMLETRDIWQDGQAAVSWLTGTHIANWVGIKSYQVSEREINSMNEKELCRKAVERLRQTLWFGFLSDQKRSFEMLQWQLGYSQKITLSKQNSNPHPNITLKEKQILESLMPLDLWLYKYAKSLFEARWTQYKTGLYKEPELSKLPEINCKSTRYVLACNKMSFIGPIYHIWNISQENTQKQMELLPKEDWMY